MERDVYERMERIEDDHWWFAGRREIIAALVGRLLPSGGSPCILDAGCGSGGNLGMLQKFGLVDAFEFDEAARTAARRKSGLDIRLGALPQPVPFEDRAYDLIGVFDVLEHLEHDADSLAALAGRLGPGGKILVTVPAFQSLWSRHDEVHHHYRRYTRQSLAEAARKAGLRVTYSSYFNTFLLPLAVASRFVKMLTGSGAPDDQVPPAWVNRALKLVFASERHLLGVIRFPVGLSLAAVLEK